MSAGSPSAAIAVLGAGAWGTALAIQAAGLGHDVLLWARDAAQAEAMARTRINARYLPGAALPATLRVGADFEAACAHARAAGGFVLLGTPMAALEPLLTRIPADLPVLWLCKGFQAGTGRLAHEVAAALRPAGAAAGVGVISGPSFADEVARGLPTALVAASASAGLAARAVQALHGGALRVYQGADVVGVEVGGAVKNVLAIAAGLVDGMALGLNARAALITRGLAEMTRLGLALGAQPHTFMGLSGLGDLVLTTTGDLSRNRRVGLALAMGRPLATVLAELGHVAEGVPSAPMALARARAAGVEMPIVEAVVAVLDGVLTPTEALARLMQREARAEGL